MALLALASLFINVVLHVTASNAETSEPADTLFLLQLGAQHVASQRVASDLSRLSDWSDQSRPINAGDSVFLRTFTGRHLTLSDVAFKPSAPRSVGARDINLRGKSGIYMRRQGEGQIASGDTVSLVDADGYYVDVEGDAVQARWKDGGDWQSFIVEKEGGGMVYAGDAVALRAHTGELLEVKGDILRCRGVDRTVSHTLTIERHPHGSLHTVVGQHGVWVLSLDRKQSDDDRSRNLRSQRAFETLGRAGVFPIAFPATDSRQVTTREQMALTCPLEADEGTTEWCQEMGREEQIGCTSTAEQATADSHRRALVAALERHESESSWTAIIEDDAVPVLPQNFDAEFEKAWAAVPADTKIVRLGWCTFEDGLPGPVSQQPLGSDESFQLIKDRWWTDKNGGNHYYTGGCTTAYIVHRSIIPEMLSMFPCCSAFDSCLERQLFYAPTKGETSEKWRGAQIMVDMDISGSRQLSSGFTSFNQSGIFVQDHRKLAGERIHF